MEQLTGIEDAITAAGTQQRLADRLGVTQQAVNKWCQRGWVPLERAAEIEAHFHIPRSRLANPKIVSLLLSADKQTSER